MNRWTVGGWMDEQTGRQVGMDVWTGGWMDGMMDR